MKKQWRKKLILACVLIMSMMFQLSASAASGRRCYLIGTSNVTVYSDSGLTRRYGSVFPSDEITVLYVTSSYCRISYPTSRGSKTGYIPTSAILTATGGRVYTAKKKITAYRRPNGASYGYVAKGDRVTIFGTVGTYTQIKYPVSGGYKYAFISTADANAWLRGTGSTPAPGSYTSLSYGLYKSNSARITCGFDGYVNQSGRHEGIDIKNAVGRPVYALTDGVIVRITRGRTGSGGLSTIAIYNQAANKTVIYLHSAPLSSIWVGRNIQRGQQIATESWRGISYQSGSHTHVEVRNGRQRSACKSVGDYKLENANPTSFWNSQGYSIR